MAGRYYVVAGLLIVLGVVGLVVASPVFGVLSVTPAHSLFYLASGGCAALAATRGLGAMRMWGKILGFAFAVLAVAGFVMDGGTASWLHLGLALLFLYHALLAPPTL